MEGAGVGIPTERAAWLVLKLTDFDEYQHIAM